MTNRGPVRYRTRASRIAGMLAVVPAVVLGGLTGPGGAAPGVARPAGTTWYVDCSAPTAGVGTRTAPFNDLESANQVVLGPGDRLLLRRGTVCAGMLEPRGDGAPGRPIVIGAYPGRSSGGRRPRIDGGGTVVAPVRLADVSYVTVEDLHLTNASDPAGIHRGLYFTSQEAPVRGVTVRGLEVSDVDSNNSFTGGKQGGGIVGLALGPAGRFSGVLIEDNRVHDVSRQAITVYGTAAAGRPPATSPWPAASTGVVIQGNHAWRIEGDGIVTLGTDGAVLQRNTVAEANLAGYDWLKPNRNCAAGIWAWNANNTVIQHNVVRDMVFGPSTVPGALNGCDGTAFDADYNQDGTIIQYNLSYDNAGGFILLCTDTAPHRVDVRYNLSVDDGATFNPAPCEVIIEPETNNLSGIRMYNNTIVAPTPRVTIELEEWLAATADPLYGAFEFENNIVYATSPAAPGHFFSCGNHCTSNLFFGLPAPPTATASVTADPGFVGPPVLRSRPRPGPRAFRLGPRSPAAGAGVAIESGFPPPASRDYFGRTVREPPSIGFSEAVGSGRGRGPDS